MWGAVIPLVAARTATLAYDRAGLGTSDPATGDRSLDRLTDDLIDVLSGIEGRVVLVGHSWGGPVSRRAAAAIPGQIAGIVLVDVTDESCDLFFSRANRINTLTYAKLSPALARTGLLKRIYAKQTIALPGDARDALLRHDTSPAAARVASAEMIGTLAGLRELRDDPPGLPDVPITWISGGKSGFGERGRRTELVAAHLRNASAAPRGRHVMAHDSGHLIPFTEPGLVADEILRVVALTG